MSAKYIVFVCTGNTCRSPMAEAMARHLLQENGVDIEVYSAGVGAFGGQPASHNALAAMQEEGLDISAHKSQPTSPTLLGDAALVLTMTAGHLAMVNSICNNANAFTLMDYAKNTDDDIHDPFGGDLETYRATAAQIKELLLLCMDKLAEI